MRHQLIGDDSFTEAEAMRLVRGLARRPRSQPQDMDNEPVRHAAIARTVEEEVIPRLLPRILKANETDRPGASPKPAPMNEDVAALTEVLLTGTQPQATAFVEHMQGTGVSGESLFLNLLTPAARKLGAMWADDDCDFASGKTGSGRFRSSAKRFSAWSLLFNSSKRCWRLPCPRGRISATWIWYCPRAS